MTISPKMAILTLVGTVAYLAIAVLGSGGLAAFFSQPPLVAVAVVTFVLVLAALTLAPLIARIRAEEKLLNAHFGVAYAAYSARTSRLIPGIY